MAGYTQTELDDVQAKWDLRFPPDLVALYRERRRVIEHPSNDLFCSSDWITSPEKEIRSALDWPLESFLFDVEQRLWWPEWGEMPLPLEDREQKFRSIFLTAPKLIPVFGHRYIPEQPNEVGNPIFSVYQMDVIFYGTDLPDYINRELHPSLEAGNPHPIREIPFWNRAVEFNVGRFQGGGGFTFYDKNDVLPK